MLKNLARFFPSSSPIALICGALELVLIRTSQLTCFHPNPLASVIVTRPLKVVSEDRVLLDCPPPDLRLLLPHHQLTQHVPSAEDLLKTHLARGHGQDDFSNLFLTLSGSQRPGLNTYILLPSSSLKYR